MLRLCHSTLIILTLLRPEEQNNPKVLPKYEPWWAKPVGMPDDSSLESLKEEATRRSLSFDDTFSRDQLAELLKRSESENSLSGRFLFWKLSLLPDFLLRADANFRKCSII
jgi:hypothetical protein